MNKKVLTLALTCVFCVQVGNLSTSYASKNIAPQNGQNRVQADVMRKRPPMPPRRPQMTKEEAAAKLHEEFGAPRMEFISLLDKDYKYNDLRTAYLYAALANVPAQKVLDLHEKATWGRVRMQLGMPAGTFAERSQEYELSKWNNSNISKSEAEKYMKQGYPLQDIKRAAAIAEATGKKTAKVLPMKTAVNDWDKVEAQLGMEKPKLDDKKMPPRRPMFNRGQRSGAGFSGLHMADMTKQRHLEILHNDYLFSVSKMEPIYDKIGFHALEDVCLHAYMGHASLNKVMKMREKYSWNRIKFKLGLTPQVYFDRCVDYQARRLKERMDIPEHVTQKLMHDGYAMHHINTAYLLAKAADKKIADVIVLKTPRNSWKDVASQLHVSEQDLKQIQEKISKDFGRHE